MLIMLRKIMRESTKKITEESASNTTISMDEKYADSGSLVFTKLNINNQGRDNNFVGGNESNAATKKLKFFLERKY